MSGDRIIVGACRYKQGAPGSAYVFEWDMVTDSWIHRATFVAPDGHVGDEFGTAVSISGDFAVVGARAHNDFRGSAYIFKRDADKDNPTWYIVANVSAPDAAV
jgi:hypothetical protein